MTTPGLTPEAQALERLSAVVALLNSDLDLPLVLRRISEAGRQLLDGIAAGVVGCRDGELRILVETGAQSAAEGVLVPYAGSTIEALDVAGLDTLVSPVAAFPAMARLATEGALQVQTVAATRISRGGETEGALYVFFPEPDRQLGSRDLRMLELLAGHAAAAIANAEAYAAVVRQRRHELAIIDAMADGLAVVDAGGIVAWWNPAAAALTGISAPDALGSSVPFPYQLRTDGGEHQLANGRWVEVLCSALPGEDPTETVVTFRDISAAKMVEETKNLFLATTGHELRTPLTVIRGFADTLSARWDELTEEERREGIRIIAVRAEGLAALVEQVLLSSQVEVGARRLQRQVIDVEPVLAAAAIDVRSLSDRHLVTVVVPAGLPQLLADEHSVRTVLGHLVDNAVKYSPEGGRIVLSAHLSADQTMICLVVDDEGIGVASEDQERVFDRFFQADGGDTRRRGGFGLGLYIVRRLVQAHDGRVAMSRRPDGQPGSRVEVCLPVGGSSEVRLSNRR